MRYYPPHPQTPQNKKKLDKVIKTELFNSIKAIFNSALIFIAATNNYLETKNKIKIDGRVYI